MRSPLSGTVGRPILYPRKTDLRDAERLLRRLVTQELVLGGAS